MASSRINRVVEDVLGGAGATDAQLLGRFVERRDEMAFEILVRRHGPMVLGVCRRVLGNHHDAEDAFQATFLVLARKAASVVPRVRLPNWLHGVAYQTARKARAVALRRRERQVGTMPELEAPAPDPGEELRAFLDLELSRLPQKYRAPLVLCALEGTSRREAARQLGLAEGTLSSRLARAKGMLAERLTRRGLIPSGGALSVLAGQGARACVPPALVTSTVETAGRLAAGQTAVACVASAPVAALTEGVLRTMCVTKLKRMALAGLLALALVGLGAGAVLSRSSAEEPPAKPAEKGGERKAKVRWEYKALTRLEIELKGVGKGRKDGLFENRALAKGLNLLGEEGWELVAVDVQVMSTPAGFGGGTSSRNTYIFKRPK